jgi:Spy/CpxP family protein refolding chaperone
MRPKMIFFASLLTALLISGNIFSQGFPGGDRGKNEMRSRDRIKEKLNLSDEQVDKIEALKLSHRKEMINLKADVELKEVELDELKSTINFSRDAYLNKIKEIIATKDKIAIAQANHRMDIYQLLGDNQKKEWNKMSRMMHDRKHQMMRKMRDKDFN